MKILCIGDPHFKTDNLVDVDMFIERSLLLIEKENPELCVILGDVLHTHENVHISPLNKAYEWIDSVRKLVPTIVLVGNHDMINQTQFLTTNHWMNGMKEWNNLTVVDKPIKKLFIGVTFYFSPYVPNGRFVEALSTVDDEWGEATAIFAHQEFAGCKMGAFVSKNGDVWDEKFPLVISGHIHSKQQPQPNVLYTGSAMQNAYGESESNSIFIFEWKDKMSVREVDLELPRKKIIYKTINDIDDYNVPEGKKDKIKVTIRGDSDELKQFKKTKKYKELTAQGAIVVFKPIEIQETFEDGSVPFLKILKRMIKKDEYKDEMLVLYNQFFHS